MDTDIPRPRWRFNVGYRLTPRLQVGLEYNPVVGEALFAGNWIAHVETDRMPMINFGTSSDRIGTPEGNRAYFVTFAKSLPRLRAAPYVSVSYSEYEKALLFPFGVNVALSREFDLLPMYDGRHSHLLLTYKQSSYSVTLMWAWLKRPGISVSFGF